MTDDSPSAAWSVQFSEDPDGKTVVRLEKGNLWVETVGAPGADKEPLYELAIVEALGMDLTRARTEEEKRFIDIQLKHAQKDVLVGQQLRLDARLEQEGAQ